MKYFYEETGMYVDWKQIKKLPEIDTLIDVGVGQYGTPELYKRFSTKKLVLIDPLDEAEKFCKDEMQNFNTIFFKTALGSVKGNKTINVEKRIGRSTILEVCDINFEEEPIDKRDIPINTLDDVIKDQDLGNIGLKIDTEGYELDVIKGSKKTLLHTKFVIAEVRHNHTSFKGVYKLHEFMNEMDKNGFLLTMILTAKPFIADLCFEPKVELSLPQA